MRSPRFHNFKAHRPGLCKSPLLSRGLPLGRNPVLDGRGNNIADGRRLSASISTILGISIQISWSRRSAGTNHLKCQDRALAMRNSGASEFVNPIGGLELYDEPALQPEASACASIACVRILSSGDSLSFQICMIDVLMHNDS